MFAFVCLFPANCRVFFEMCLSILLRSVLDFAFLYALTSPIIDDLRYLMMTRNLKSR